MAFPVAFSVSRLAKRLMMGSPSLASSCDTIRPRLLSVCISSHRHGDSLIVTCELACRASKTIESRPLSHRHAVKNCFSRVGFLLFFGSIAHFLTPAHGNSEMSAEENELLSHSINVFLSLLLTVLGNHLRRAWHRRYWCIPWRFRSSIGAHQCLLQ
jgi:hypothetical protein